MARSATLAINIISDASGASRGIDEAATKVEKFRSGLDKASLAAGGVLAGLGALGKEAFDQASALEQSTGAINAVFGDWALDIEQSAQQAATAVGLSTSAYEEMASVIGSQLKNAGMPIADVTAKTQDLIKTGADMSAVFGGTAADAVEALSSALKGEFDPLEKYGVSLNQAAIDAQLAADGTANLEGAQAQAAKTQAILELITAQTAATQGQYTAQSGSAAEQTQQLGAQLDNAAATLGQQLLPVVVAVVGKLSEFATWASQNKTLVTGLAIVIGGMAAAVLITNAAMAAWTAATTIATAAQWLWNVALDANPLGLIVLAIAAVVGAVILMYNKFEWFRDLVGAIGDFFSGAWSVILDVIGWIWDKVQALGDVFSTVFNWIADVMSPVTDVLKWIADKIEWVIDKAKAVGDFFGNLFGAPAGPPVVAPPGGTRGLLGAPLRSAGLLTAGGSIGASPSGASSGLGTVVNVTVNGALDPVAVGRQLQSVLRDYGRSTGGQLAVALGRSR